jgi:hypothetical protein
MRTFAVGFIFAAALATSAHAGRAVITPSGLPDAVFDGSDVADTGAKIANACMNKGWSITNQTGNQVVCEIPVSIMKAAFQQMLIGNSYSTTPRTFVRFSIAQVGSNARVQANSWVETQMAFGQMRQQPYTDDGTLDALQGFMIEAGGALPPGSRIPGAYLGFDGTARTEGRAVSIPVSVLIEGSPGAVAGMRVGDELVSVNGQKFKSMDDMKAKLGKIAIGNEFPIEVRRAGQSMRLTVKAVERPAVGTKEWAELEAATKRARGIPEAVQP